MRYFSINELSHSSTAKSRGIDNTPDAYAITNMTELVNKLLDPIREKWGRPITVNSGYRSPELNAAVGGVSTSQHLRGQAADINAGSRQSNEELFNLILELQKTNEITFDQLIDESNFK